MKTLPQSTERDLKIRLKNYGLRVLRLYDSLPRFGSAQVIGRQVVRSGTSPGAQYREACRAKSDADSVSKMEGALQELDECDYWFQLLVEGGYLPASKLESLRIETNELISDPGNDCSQGEGASLTTFILHPSSFVLHPFR